MKTLKELVEELNILQNEMKAIYTKLQDLGIQKTSYENRLQQAEKSLYEKTVAICHMKEIFRIAKIQFTRLRGKDSFTQEDINELNKWIGRAKGEDGLKDIINALNELEKYVPSDIKQNLYALVQRIIIGGAYKQKRRV